MIEFKKNLRAWAAYQYALKAIIPMGKKTRTIL